MAHSFPIHTAAERTGLTPHVIRAWERRYRAIQPERSPGKHRLYSEAEIERLALLQRAVRQGHSIGKIASLPTDELREMISPARGGARLTAASAMSDPAAAFRAESLAAVTRFDGPVFQELLQRALVMLGHQGLLRRGLASLAQEIGDAWRAGGLTAAHEHFFTANVKMFLGDIIRQSATSLAAPRIVVSTPAGQLHELGAVMAAASAANLGWHPIYLGPNLPAHEIAGAALRNDAAAVALSVVYPEDDPNLARELADLSRLLPPGSRLLVGGRAARHHFETLVRIGAVYADSLEEFGEQLDALRRANAAKRDR